MKDLICGEYQNAVSSVLIRHRSMLDTMSKLEETNARVNRAVAKAITTCGCLKLHAEKQQIPRDASLHEMRKYMETHLRGSLCDTCRDAIETELGAHLFYVAAMCNLLDINLYDVFVREHKKIATLGVFNLT